MKHKNRHDDKKSFYTDETQNRDDHQKSFYTDETQKQGRSLEIILHRRNTKTDTMIRNHFTQTKHKNRDDHSYICQPDQLDSVRIPNKNKKWHVKGKGL